MEQRFYFIAGDILSNGVMGMTSAWLVTVLVDPAWPMLSAMLAGMAAGMGLSLLLMPVFVALFGAMEVMLPVMLTAMLTGMLFAMAATMEVLATSVALIGGGFCGILILLLTYAADSGLRGKLR